VSDKADNLQDKPELPRGWVKTTLGEACTRVQYGWTTSAVESGNYKLLRTTDITSGFIEWSNVPFCRDEPPELDKFFLGDGDIVVSRAGSVGASILVTSPPQAVFASYLIRLRSGIDQKFVAYFMKSPFFWQQVEDKAAGIAMANLNASKLQQMSLLVPPLKEQQRIVEKLETLLSDLDAAVASLETAKEKLKGQRQALLRAAVEGELSREWRETNQGKIEPASELLKHVLQERRERWEVEQKTKRRKNANYEEPKAPDTTNLPELPEGWVWANLNQLKAFSLYGPRFSSDDYSSKGVNVLRTTDINESGKVNIETTPKLDLSNNDFDKYHLERGDLLITRTGSIGTLAVFNDEVRAIAGAYLIQYRLIDPSMVWYIFYFLKSPNGQMSLTRGSAGSGRLNLNAPNIETIPIPLPSLQEQVAIVERIEQLHSDSYNLETSIGAELKRTEVMRQSILKQAFEGTLVAQNSNDENASVLLERIREEKERIAKEPKVKRPKTPRKNKAEGDRVPLVETLRQAQKPLSPEELFRASGHDAGSVEAFYTELKEATSAGLIVEARNVASNRDSLLTASP
jgi:type I restriction enzyme, S subunit